MVARIAPERVRGRVAAGTFTPWLLFASDLLASGLSPVDVRGPGGGGGGERWDLSDMRNCVREADAG